MKLEIHRIYLHCALLEEVAGVQCGGHSKFDLVMCMMYDIHSVFLLGPCSRHSTANVSELTSAAGPCPANMSRLQNRQAAFQCFCGTELYDTPAVLPILLNIQMKCMYCCQSNH